jgi:hypothetical protein
MDFWPLVPISRICADIDDGFNKTVIFGDQQKPFFANGVIGARKNDRGLRLIVDEILGLKGVPEWGSHGTIAVTRAWTAHQHYAKPFTAIPMSKITPFLGKAAALGCMRDQKAIAETKAAGAYAIHFEMTDTLDFDW